MNVQELMRITPVPEDLRQWWEDAVAKPYDNLLPRQQAPQQVKCLSCGGTFTRSADGSIPCGH